ncbi:MAG: acyltransferase [Ruminococcus sp.]|nr:acyltransferase [Ruminococcus sp.]
MATERDRTLDRMRGFAMLWVVFVHVLYWGAFYTSPFTDILKSFLLFEMPLFFFITGATNSMSRDTGYFSFVYKRFARVLIPYWVFAAICAVLSVGKYTLENGFDPLKSVLITGSWLVPIDRQFSNITYLTWALWFVPVYLCIVLLIPLMKKLVGKPLQFVMFGTLLGVFVISDVLNLGFVQKISFYALWTFAGMYYPLIREKLTSAKTRVILGAVAVLGAGVLTLLGLSGVSLDMQYNKFPPNMVFLVYSCTAMGVVGLLTPVLDSFFGKIEKTKFLGKIFEQFSVRSMTVFLYQVFAFNITLRAVAVLIPFSSPLWAVVKVIFCLVTTVLLCALLGVAFGWAEKIQPPSLERKHK